MAIPKTYLYCAPDAEDPFGRCIQASELYRGLRKLNRNIYMWQQHPDHHWWPGKVSGTNCLWVGDPGGSSQKITAFNWGPVPEFTQMGPDGAIISKGWRAIFERVVKMKLVSVPALEQHFSVNLSDLEKSPFCPVCLRRNVMKRTGGIPCTQCANRQEIANQAVQAEKERLIVHVNP